MFYVKNDDMEDMMRKAADNYELNEDMAADWSKVRAALQDEDAFITSTKKEKKRRKLYLLWWLLLIPAIWIITYKTGLYNSDKKQNTKTTIAKKPNSPVQKSLSGNHNTISGNNSTSSQSNTNGKSIAITYSKKIATNNKLISAQAQSPLDINNETSENKTSVVSANADADKNILNSQAFPQSATIANNSNQTDNNSSKNNLMNDLLNNKNTEILNNKTNSIQKDNKADVAKTNASVQKKKTDNYTRQAFAYTGLTGNADISFIKFQKASSPGIGIGIIGGYHFKSGISIETGILYDKKSYYTKGEYFDKGKLSYLQNVNLISADGNCHMWEIPLNFKYDFNTQKKHNWFVTAGVSSYIMNKEYYNFKYEKNGMINENAYNYYHSSQNWFSILNVGGGINIKTGNKYFLQAQPYYKIPLSGIGKGSLSLNSAGINISLTRRLH